MRHFLLFLSFFALFLGTATTPTHAQEAEPDHYVQFRALSEIDTIAAGESIWIALEQELYPEWHSYWVNPGDSGAPTRVEWDLPEGFTITQLQWPTPHKLPYGPLLNYGYEGNVVALQKLTAPESFGGEKITLSGQAESLVCKDICIPEFGPVSITLNGENSIDNRAYVDAARAKMPTPSDLSAHFSQEGDNFVLRIEGTDICSAQNPCTDLEIFPYEWGLIVNTETPVGAYKDSILNIVQTASEERDIAEVTNSRIIIAYTDSSGARTAVEVNAEHQKITPVKAATDNITVEETQSPQNNMSLIAALGFALLGGLILNLMPCVFPVLSLKALSLAKLSKEDHSVARVHGLSYTTGVVLSFLAIASLLIFLKSIGAQIGWGFQLQNPLVVTLLAYLLFIVGLNLSGLFEFANPFGSTGQKLTSNHSASGSFFTGVLATLVATPCTAPFMAAALGYALVQPAAISLSIFAALGLGLALPFLALSFVPALGKVMPKPGAWMDTFKQFLAFPMFASAAWLVWVMSKQASSSAVLATLIGMVAISFGLWLWGKLPKAGLSRAILKTIAIISLISPLALLPSPSSVTQTGEQTLSLSLNEEAFSQDALSRYLENTNDPVFVEMTADWCITCKVNKATSINIAGTKKVIADNNVKYLLGDWTNRDERITQYLQQFNRSGVPLYVYYAPRPDALSERPAPKILPQILTPNIIQKALSGEE